MRTHPYVCAYSLDMHLRKQKKPSGRIYLSIVQSYRASDGKSRSKTLWSLGYVDELKKTHTDPVAHFQQVVDDLNSMRCEDGLDAPVSFSFTPQAKIPLGYGGYIELGSAVVLRALHRDLHVNAALDKCAQSPAQRSNLSHLVELLVWNRIAHPQIIVDAWKTRSGIPGLESMGQEDLFEGVEELGQKAALVREHISNTLKERVHFEKQAFAFCFVTNFYIEETSWTHPEHRKQWDNRANPLVQFAILIDPNGIPLDYSVLETTLSTPLSSFPVVQDLAIRYPELRLVVVSNKTVGTNTYDLAFLKERNCGFVLLQSLRKGPRESREWAINETGYTPFGSDGSRFKERLGMRTIAADYNGKRHDSMAVKEVAFWWREAFEQSRYERFRVIKRNEDVFAHGAPSEGSVRPIRAIRGFGDAKPGEVGDHIWDVYWDKVSADEAMDGFCNILTSELDLAGSQVVSLYQNLFMMQHFLKPAWGEWSNCPGDVSRSDYIQAHFLSCFLAAATMQLLYREAGTQFPDQALGTTLARLTGREVSPGQFFFDFRSHLSDALAEYAGVDLSHSLLSASDAAHLIQSSRKES